jgi:4-deoxy-L-threo-5-hexosulose-uronate ketol-isomerase
MKSEIRFASHPKDVKHYTTEQLREHYHIAELFVQDEVKLVYSMHDRFITMGVQPSGISIKIPAFEEYTKAEYFLERREMGIINIGGAGSVKVDGETFILDNKECLYIGKGKKDISFSSKDAESPALFYINSTPAHKTYPIVKAEEADANKVELGSKEQANVRVIYQYIHEGGIASCQLVMGYTQLQVGSVWNTFPPHTHHRRMEVYCYFDLPDDQLVMHFMGQPEQTRHIAIKNKEAVISPEWSIHAGAGTSAYAFVWGMGGENKAFTDMDGIAIDKIR